MGEAYGFPAGYRDPSFSEVSERFFRIADRYSFKYSIYVIGKDLEKKENRERIREWSSSGHEIGNHSWSHPYNLGAMDKPDIRREVETTHELISKTTGVEPKGFISPAWSSSSKLIEVLVDLGYLYDTSSFPSWLMYLFLAKNFYNHIGSDKLFKMLNRRDYLVPLLGPRQAYRYGSAPFGKPGQSSKGITIMPLPSNRLRIACWHTLCFAFGWKAHARILKSALESVDAFYYLMHPADLIDGRDLDSTRKIHQERLHVPLEDKTRCLERSIELILESGRKLVTMEELAEKAFEGPDV